MSSFLNWIDSGFSSSDFKQYFKKSPPVPFAFLENKTQSLDIHADTTTIVAFESVQAERNLRICELSKTRVEDELPTQTLHFFCRGKSLKITQTKFALFDSQDPWKKKKSSKKTMAQIHSRKRKPKKTPLSSNIQVDTSGNNRDGRVLQSFPGSKNLLVSH